MNLRATEKAPTLMVSYGHSWVDGDGASSKTSCFAALTAHELRMALDNRAVGGSGSSATAKLVTSNPPPAAELFVVMTGLNDLRLYGDDPTGLSRYSSSLEQILTMLRRASPQSVVITVAQPHLVDFSLFPPHDRGSNELIDRYNMALRRAAAEDPRVVLAEADDWNPHRMLDDDTVHPNNAGHACLARATARKAIGL